MAISVVDVQSQYDGPVVYYTLAADSALLGDRLAVVVTAEHEIRTTLDEFYGLADTEYLTALETLINLSDVELVELPPIEFTAPPFTNTPYTNALVDDNVDTPATGLSSVEPPDSEAPTLTHSGLDPQFNLTGPDDIFPTTPPEPTLDNTSSVVPDSISAYNVTVPNAPTFNTPDFNPGSVNAPSLRDVTFNLPDEIEFDSEQFTIDESRLDEAVDRLNNIADDVGDIPDYEYLFDEVFEVVGNMLSGDAVNDDAFLRDNGKLRLVAPSLARRGHEVPAPVSAYDTWHAGRISEFVRDSESLFLARFRDDVVVAAYGLATEAETMAADIATKLYNLRRALEVERARVSLAVAQAVASSYNAYAALYEARVAEYNGQLSIVRGAVRALNARVSARQSTGEVNQLIARQFAQQESTKGLDVEVFAARVQAEAAKLDGYKAKIDSYEGQLANAKANALNYAAYAMQYSGQVEQVKARYSAYEASAQSTSSQNDLAVAVQRGRGSEYKAEAAKAEASARRVSATVLEYVADHEASKIDTTTYLGNLAKTSGDFGVCLEEDLNEIRKNKLDNLAESIPREYLTDISNRFVGYANRASDVGWRTLEGSLRASEALSRSYARMYEALGRAAASIEVGRLGQFRASYATSVSGSIGVSSNANRTIGTNRTLAHQQSNNDSQSN